MDEEPIEIPITDVFDLHSVHPRDAKQAVEAYLEEAHRLGYRALRIIHGRGIGVQREMVRKVLTRTSFVSSFSDAPMEAGGWGATVVTLGGDVSMAAASQQLSDELAGLIRQYDAALADAQSVVSTLTIEQFNWREDVGRWSVGECLEHLALAGAIYAFESSQRHRRWKTARSFRRRSFSIWLARIVLPATDRAPTAVSCQGAEGVPLAPMPGRPELNPQTTLASYREGNRRLRTLVQEANGLDLRRIKTGSPATDLLQWSLGVILAIIPAHDRRHLWQARQVVRKGFAVDIPSGYGG